MRQNGDLQFKRGRMNRLNDTNRKLVNIKFPGELKTPYRIQEYLDKIPYSDEAKYRCPATVLVDRKAHCFDGAVLAAALLQRIGYPPQLVELLPNDRDDDHIIALFRERSGWGAVGKSNFVGLRYREPVYRDLRELVMSYFEPYYNIAGERTLVGYTAPLDLDRAAPHDWMIRDESMEMIGEAFDRLRRYRVISPAAARKLTRVDKRSYKAGLLGAAVSGLYKP